MTTMVSLTGDAKAALMLTVSELTSDRLSVGISGSFDADVVGDQNFWLALKADWSFHNGSNVDWIADSVGVGGYGFGLTYLNDTVAFSGLNINRRNIDASGQSYGDSIYWGVNGPITAGTLVSGSLALRGPGVFKPNGITSLQLVSGFNNAQADFQRLEATAAVPEPSTALILGIGTLVAASRRRARAHSRLPGGSILATSAPALRCRGGRGRGGGCGR